MRKLMIALAASAVLVGCSDVDKMNACGRSCVYGMKSFQLDDKDRPACTCVTIDDLCNGRNK